MDTENLKNEAYNLGRMAYNNRKRNDPNSDNELIKLVDLVKSVDEHWSLPITLVNEWQNGWVLAQVRDLMS